MIYATIPLEKLSAQATQEDASEKDFSMEANVKYYTSKMPTIKSDMSNAYHICDRCFDSHAQNMECECGGECYSWQTKTLQEAKEMAQELEEMSDCLERDIAKVVQCGRKLGVELAPEIIDYAMDMFGPCDLSLKEHAELIIEHTEGVPLESVTLKDYKKLMPRPCDKCNKVKDEMEHCFGLVWTCDDCDDVSDVDGDALVARFIFPIHLTTPYQLPRTRPSRKTRKRTLTP